MSGLYCGPACFPWAWGVVEGEAEAGTGQGEGAAWVGLPHHAGGLREGISSVQGTAGLGGRLLAVCSSVTVLGTRYQRF